MCQREIDAAVKGEPCAEEVINKLVYNHWFGSMTVFGSEEENRNPPTQEQIDVFNKKVAERFEKSYGRQAFQKWADPKKFTSETGPESVSVMDPDTGRSYGVPIRVARSIWELGWIMSIKANKKE